MQHPIVSLYVTDLIKKFNVGNVDDLTAIIVTGGAGVPSVFPSPAFAVNADKITLDLYVVTSAYLLDLASYAGISRDEVVV